MIINFKSVTPIQFDPNNTIELCGIEDGDSVSVIREKMTNKFSELFTTQYESANNIDEIVDTILPEVLISLKYYIRG